MSCADMHNVMHDGREVTHILLSADSRYTSDTRLLGARPLTNAWLCINHRLDI